MNNKKVSIDFQAKGIKDIIDSLEKLQNRVSKIKLPDEFTEQVKTLTKDINDATSAFKDLQTELSSSTKKKKSVRKTDVQKQIEDLKKQVQVVNKELDSVNKKTQSNVAKLETAFKKLNNKTSFTNLTRNLGNITKQINDMTTAAKLLRDELSSPIKSGASSVNNNNSSEVSALQTRANNLDAMRHEKKYRNKASKYYDKGYKEIEKIVYDLEEEITEAFKIFDDVKASDEKREKAAITIMRVVKQFSGMYSNDEGLNSKKNFKDSPKMQQLLDYLDEALEKVDAYTLTQADTDRVFDYAKQRSRKLKEKISELGGNQKADIGTTDTVFGALKDTKLGPVSKEIKAIRVATEKSAKELAKISENGISTTSTEEKNVVRKPNGSNYALTDIHGNVIKWYRGTYGANDGGAFISDRYNGAAFYVNNPMISATYGGYEFPQRIHETTQAAYNPYIVKGYGRAWNSVPFFGLKEDGNEAGTKLRELFEKIYSEIGNLIEDSETELMKVFGNDDDVKKLVDKVRQGASHGGVIGFGDYTNIGKEVIKEIREFHNILSENLEYGLKKTGEIVEYVQKYGKGAYDAVLFEQIFDIGSGGTNSVSKYLKDKNALSDILVQFNPENVNHIKTGPSSDYLDAEYMKALMPDLKKQYDKFVDYFEKTYKDSELLFDDNFFLKILQEQTDDGFGALKAVFKMLPDTLRYSLQDAMENDIEVSKYKDIIKQSIHSRLDDIFNGEVVGSKSSSPSDIAKKYLMAISESRTLSPSIIKNLDNIGGSQNTLLGQEFLSSSYMDKVVKEFVDSLETISVNAAMKTGVLGENPEIFNPFIDKFNEFITSQSLALENQSNAIESVNNKENESLDSIKTDVSSIANDVRTIASKNNDSENDGNYNPSDDLAKGIKGWVEASNIMSKIEAQDLSEKDYYGHIRTDVSTDRERGAYGNTKTGSITNPFVTSNKDYVDGKVFALLKQMNNLLEYDLNIHSHPDDYIAPSGVKGDLGVYANEPHRKGLIVGRKQAMLIDPSAVGERYGAIAREYDDIYKSMFSEEYENVMTSIINNLKISFKSLPKTMVANNFQEELLDTVSNNIISLLDDETAQKIPENYFKDVARFTSKDFKFGDIESVQTFVKELLSDKNLFGDIHPKRIESIAKDIANLDIFNLYKNLGYGELDANSKRQATAMFGQYALKKAFEKEGPEGVKYSDFVKTLNYDNPNSLSISMINDFLGIANTESTYLGDISDAVRQILVLLSSGNIEINSTDNTDSSSSLSTFAPRTQTKDAEAEYISRQKKSANIRSYRDKANKLLSKEGLTANDKTEISKFLEDIEKLNNRQKITERELVDMKVRWQDINSVAQENIETHKQTVEVIKQEDKASRKIEESNKKKEKQQQKILEQQEKEKENLKQEALELGKQEDEAQKKYEQNKSKRNISKNQREQTLVNMMSRLDTKLNNENLTGDARKEVEQMLATLEEVKNRAYVTKEEFEGIKTRCAEINREAKLNIDNNAKIAQQEKERESQIRKNKNEQEKLHEQVAKQESQTKAQQEKELQAEEKARLKSVESMYSKMGTLSRKDNLDNATVQTANAFLEKLKEIKEQGKITEEEFERIKLINEQINVQADESINNQKEFNSLIDKLNKIQNKRMAGNATESYYMPEVLSEVSSAIANAKDKLSRNDEMITKGDITQLKELISKIDSADGSMIRGSKDVLQRYIIKGEKMLSTNYLPGNLSSQLRETVDQMRELDAQEVVSVDSVNKLTSAFRMQEIEAAKLGKTFIGQIGQRLKDMNAKFIATYFSFMDIIRYTRSMISTITELDTALTEMRKVSDESTKALKEYQKTTFDTAGALGTTAVQLQQSTADWMRLGESMEEAAKSAQSATTLLNVSEFENINDATTALVAMSQAYKDMDKTEIIDVMNNIGNNYSIATDQLAMALQNSAAVLMTQGNDLYEATALVTAANAIVQDYSKSGTGIRTIALRMAGVKAGDDEIKKELEEMGEEVDDWVVSTQAKKRQVIMDYTRVASNQGQGIDILDSNGNLRDTYHILLDIAKIYKEIQEEDEKYGTNRAKGLVEELAGKVLPEIYRNISLGTHLIAGNSLEPFRLQRDWKRCA